MADSWKFRLVIVLTAALQCFAVIKDERYAVSQPFSKLGNVHDEVYIQERSISIVDTKRATSPNQPTLIVANKVTDKKNP